MTENLEQLEKEMRQLSAEIVEMKKLSEKFDGEDKEKLINEVRAKQYQALFYIEKVNNLSKQMRGKTQ